MDRNLALEFVRVTEYAALASSLMVGRGDEKKADQAAVSAMRNAFGDVQMSGTVVIGEGERDEAPMLYIGEKVGAGGLEVDVAVDPLEGTTLCAKGDVGAISVLAVADKGTFLHAPDVYMKKLAVGSEAKGKVHLDQTPREIFQTVSECLSKPMEDLTVMILERKRHKELIEQCRSLGVRIRLISDGDVSAGIATCWPDSGVDILLGIGGAPEGVLTAAALKCLGGDFQGQLYFSHDPQGLNQQKRAKQMGIEDLSRVYSLEELVAGSVIFCATGVTDGPFLKGVKSLSNRKATTHSMVMRSDTGTIRNVLAEHDLSRKRLK